MRPHTHYDNLKVARNAPASVIKAAYRVLSQQYHPDRNQDNPDAGRIMTLINAAYEALSDPDRRAQYDRILERQEAEARADELQRMQRTAEENRQAQERQQTNPQKKTERAESDVTKPVRPSRQPQYEDPDLEALRERWGFTRNTQNEGRHSKRDAPDDMHHLHKYWWAYVLLIGSIWMVTSKEDKQSRSIYSDYQTSDIAYTSPTVPSDESSTVPAESAYVPSNPITTEEPRYERPPKAPNGQPWPHTAGYMDGYLQLNEEGASLVVVDNSRNDADVFVELIVSPPDRYSPFLPFEISPI